MLLQHSRVNCHGLRLIIYDQILVLTIILSKDLKKLFTAFYSQTNGQIERQNSTIKVYPREFIN